MRNGTDSLSSMGFLRPALHRNATRPPAQGSSNKLPGKINCLAYFRISKSSIYMGFIGEFIQNLPQWRRPQLRCPRTHSNTTTTYNPDSTVAETNGDQTYRVSHTYDYAQRQISMTTYGTTTATTTWQYSPDRGFLLAKRDAANKGATYTAAGRLASRTWGRSSGALPKVTSPNFPDKEYDYREQRFRKRSICIGTRDFQRGEKTELGKCGGQGKEREERCGV